MCHRLFPSKLLGRSSLGSLSRGFTPRRHLRPFSVRDHTVVQYIQSGDDDYLMNETRRKVTTGTRFPTLFDIVAGDPLYGQLHRHGWTRRGLFTNRSVGQKADLSGLTIIIKLVHRIW